MLKTRAILQNERFVSIECALERNIDKYDTEMSSRIIEWHSINAVHFSKNYVKST